MGARINYIEEQNNAYVVQVVPLAPRSPVVPDGVEPEAFPFAQDEGSTFACLSPEHVSDTQL